MTFTLYYIKLLSHNELFYLQAVLSIDIKGEIFLLNDPTKSIWPLNHLLKLNAREKINKSYSCFTFSDESDQENLLSSAFRSLTETRIGIQDNLLEVHFSLNIRGGVLENAGNFYTYHLKLQNALDKKIPFTHQFLKIIA